MKEDLPDNSGLSAAKKPGKKTMYNLNSFPHWQKEIILRAEIVGRFKGLEPTGKYPDLYYQQGLDKLVKFMGTEKAMRDEIKAIKALFALMPKIRSDVVKSKEKFIDPCRNSSISHIVLVEMLKQFPA